MGGNLIGYRGLNQKRHATTSTSPSSKTCNHLCSYLYWTQSNSLTPHHTHYKKKLSDSTYAVKQIPFHVTAQAWKSSARGTQHPVPIR